VAISIVQAVIVSVFGDLGSSRLLGLGLSFLVGLVIWLIGVTDPKAQMSPRDVLISAFLALINSCTLYLASQGLLGQIAIGTHAGAH
jgi:hypothetical protein